MEWIHEVSMYLYVEKGTKCPVLYRQFENHKEAVEFATNLYDGSWPTQTVEVTIKVTPKA